MQFNFSKLFNNEKNVLLDDFLYKNASCMYTFDDEESIIIRNYYKNVFDILNGTFELEDILIVFEKIAKYKILLDIPYIIMVNAIYSLENIIISQISKLNINLYIIEILDLFKAINNRVAFIYLQEYINKLLSINNIRHSSLSDIVEKSIIGYYESHLTWLTSLATNIQNENTASFVELDDTVCDFGKWLHNDAKNIIQNNSKYKRIINLHRNLHIFGKKIYAQIGKKEYHILITYLEKCELISLSIGTELALIDNIIMNKRITKDSLTGSLNRQALRSVFESQYELSLATSNSFILVMCDLDFFKGVNDKFGHIAGDRMLKLFVNVVKENIRNTDIIIRYGGEEFIILLPTAQKKHAIKVLENIRKNFENSSLDFDGQIVKTTVSMGVVEIKPEEYFKRNFIDEYIMIADKKLYNAKNNGRNRIEV